MDLAIEMSANEYIEEPLPDPITWQPYASLGLRAGQSTLERYERLVDGSTAKSAGELADDHRYLRRATPNQALSSRPGSSSHARRRRLASNTPAVATR
jgi:hypothetical protein